MLGTGEKRVMLPPQSCCSSQQSCRTRPLSRTRLKSHGCAHTLVLQAMTCCI